MEEEDKLSDLFKKTISAFIIVLGVVVILITGNTITGYAISSNEVLRISDVTAAIWGFLIVLAGIWIGFIKE